MQATLKLIFFALLFAALLCARVGLLLSQESEWTISTYAAKNVSITGVITDDPDVRTTGVRIPLRVESVNGEKEGGTLLAVLPPGTNVSYKEEISVKGKVELPQNFETNTGHEFDYVNYLRVRGISATMERATLVSQKPGGATLLGFLFSIKHSFENSLESLVPKPQASLLEGILLGDRGGFSSALLAAFTIVGLIHVVVLSGSNIAIVAEAVFRTLSFLPRRASYVVGAIVMILFVLMTGSGPAAVRAALMASVAILARILRRPNDALRALMLAAVLMLLWNPLFVFDTGFVLSMLATFGLITLAPAIETHLSLVPDWSTFNLRSIVATTLAVEIFILPALLYYSGVLSIISLPLNALILPFIPLVMLLGFITGLLGLVSYPLALVPALLCNILLRLMLLITQWSATLPFASATVAPFSAWIALLVYAPIFIGALTLYMRQKLVRLPT